MQSRESGKGVRVLIFFFLPVPFAAKLLHFQLFFLAVPGGLEKRYSCCEGIVGSAGCQIAKVGLMFFNAVSQISLVSF